MASDDSFQWLRSNVLGQCYRFMPDRRYIQLEHNRQIYLASDFDPRFLQEIDYLQVLHAPQHPYMHGSPPDNTGFTLERNDEESLVQRFTQLSTYAQHQPAAGTQGSSSNFIPDHDPRNHVKGYIKYGPGVTTDPELVQQGITAHAQITGDSKGKDTEKFFKDYKLRKPSFYCVGRVLMVCWPEPEGNGPAATAMPGQDPWANMATVVTGGSRKVRAFNKQGSAVYTKVRRFIVIREGKGYCSAIAIFTYGDRGVSKQGVTKSEHGIAYTGPTPQMPIPLEEPQHPNEDPMLPFAIRIDPDSTEELLTPMSRIMYGKVYTVEHNVRAKSVGQVNANHLWLLSAQFHAAWQAGFLTHGFGIRAELSILQRLEYECGLSADEARDIVTRSRSGQDLTSQIEFRRNSTQAEKSNSNDVFEDSTGTSSRQPTDQMTSASSKSRARDIPSASRTSKTKDREAGTGRSGKKTGLEALADHGASSDILRAVKKNSSSQHSTKSSSKGKERARESADQTIAYYGGGSAISQSGSHYTYTPAGDSTSVQRSPPYGNISSISQRYSLDTSGTVPMQYPGYYAHQLAQQGQDGTTGDDGSPWNDGTRNSHSSRPDGGSHYPRSSRQQEEASPDDGNYEYDEYYEDNLRQDYG